MPDEAHDSEVEMVEFDVDDSEAGMRLDALVAKRLPDYSRTHLRRIIVGHGVLVDGKNVKASTRLHPQQHICLELPELVSQGPRPEDIPLSILFEDEVMVVLDKPPRMVVHPSKGHSSGTLASGLQYHFDQLSTVGGPTRPGIVHRLDRDTSGVIVVAKTDQAHLKLAEQFASRTVKKEYTAIVVGQLDRDRDWIDQPLGRHKHQREKMAIRSEASGGRAAKTFYEVVERFDAYTLLRVQPRTGRTHQIRVHLASTGCPVLCDRLYGSRARITRGELEGSDHEDLVLDRQALHARRIEIAHPLSGDRLEFEAPLPGDIQRTLDCLRHR